ncbi:deleted in lung and esophageal cancer protein 1-like isoform X2 [Dendronephthya gigantea]|uniref:deleted in lung and esophageal cancer protein 1-like isoform X2 n=1 Tax=Dendronephthya gigantea TaxID=151771 RepID=UPI00106C18AB|nr:deleted in lung and esophageal cancer protein 1-like isoform X2 [Dendronephthya gigantea]
MESVIDKNHEPPMFLQRPSLGRSQDVSHILARVFRDLTRESVGEQTVKNLTISRSGEERYHEEYVERLAKIQSERQRQLDELAMLETHIMQARAAATASEEQELQRASEECSNYESLGLPPVKSHLRYMMDVALLKKFNLITPDDYISAEYQRTQPPHGCPLPSYARPTTSSLLHTNKEHVTDNYIEESAEAMTYPFTAESPISTEDKPSIKVSRSAKSRVTSSWRDSIKPDQRHQERTDLQKLNAKVEYLRNPRNIPPNSYPTLIKTEPKKSSNKERLTARVMSVKSSDVLIPSPSPVIFTEYEVGKVYEIKLELKNVSSSSRQIRVLPPATKFFSIGLGQYPAEHGIIAPGMSCQFAVKFAPDSLTDYVDKVQIRTQLDDSLDIAVLGKRKPPQLTIPTILDCGYCLVGGNKTVVFKCLNVGGPGRFCILHESEWPTTSWKWSLANPGYLALEPFCVQPAMFQLLEGEEILLKLTFQPVSAKYYKHEIYMVCDNCQVKRFTIQGVGQTARVQFMSIDGGISQAVIGESCDLSANHLVRFSDQNPCTTVRKKMVLKNMSNVPLPFYWKIMKPRMRSCKNDKNRQFAPEKHSVFSIKPSSGVFQPDVGFQFEVTSSPTEIGDFHSVAHLVLEKIPVSSSAESVQQDEDVTSMKVEFKLFSKPFQVMVDPPILIIPGKRLAGKTYKFDVKIKNNSVSKTSYEWQTSPVIDIQPKSGDLDIDQEETLELSICATKAGSFSSTVKCDVNYSSDPVYVHVKANFEGPLVRVDNADIDFGLVRFSRSALRTVAITNLSEVAAVWSLKEASPYNLIDIDKGYKEMPSEFQFSPHHGVLGPFQRVDVEVVFKPLTCRRVRSVFQCDVVGSEISYIRATAEVQKPEICLLSSNVAFEEIYVDVPIVKEIVLENKTLMFTKVSWKNCLGNDSQFCSVEFQPSSWDLGPREQKTFTVLFTGSKEGLLNDVVAVCEAEGMEKLLYLSFTGTIRGLQVTFGTDTPQKEDQKNNLKSEDENQLVLNYGKTNLGDTPKALLILTNKTAIATKFDVSVEHFSAARTPTPPTGSAKRNIRGHSILAKTPNIADPLSKTPSKSQADFVRSLLRDGRGAAFVCRPSCGELLPYQECAIEVTAYTDMWGEYSDNLICKVHGLEDKRVPIVLTVEGCPLNFQMSKEISPIVRFGSHVSGAPVVERVLRVNNTSPCDIRLDWEVYNIDEEDDQLIDLIIDIGEPHPKIVDGKDVVPAKHGSDVPLVTVDVRQHVGRQENVPFKIKQPQQIVPARKHSDLKVVFTPCSNMTSDVVCNSFTLGFISLDSIEELESCFVKRCTGRYKEPFRLNMTASIKPAILSVAADDGTHFETSASDLLKTSNGSIFETMKEVHKTSYYTLTNTSDALVSFRMLVEKPFNILDISAPPSAYTKDNTKITSSKIISLKPRRNVQISIGFCLSHDMLFEETQISDIVESKQNGLLPVLEVQKNLQIMFSNKTTQTLPLTAVVSLPHLLLSKEKIDFGVGLVGHTKVMTVKLTNFGKSASSWFVEKDSRYPAESREVFGVEPTCGFLEGHISNVSNNDVLLKLTFVPRSCIDYECVIVFKGLLNEPDLHLLVTARGSYDGGHEDLVTTATL